LDLAYRDEDLAERRLEGSMSTRLTMRKMATTKRLLVAIMIAGCGTQSMQEVRGVVTLDGHPVPNAAVFFLLEGDENAVAMGNTNFEGKVVMHRISSIRAIPSNTYKVVVIPINEREQNRGPGVAEIYRDAATTPLTVEVPLNEEFSLNLASQK
jgi:hypothetical protein